MLSSPASAGNCGAGARSSPIKWLAIGVAAVLLASRQLSLRLRYANPCRGGETGTVQGPVTSLAIVPFYNATGDPSLNSMGSVIADALNSDIGQSAHLRMVSADRLQQVLTICGYRPQSPLDLQTVDELPTTPMLTRWSSASTKDWASRFASAATLPTSRMISKSSLSSNVANEKQLLASLEKMADDMREKLAATS